MLAFLAPSLPNSLLSRFSTHRPPQTLAAVHCRPTCALPVPIPLGPPSVSLSTPSLTFSTLSWPLSSDSDLQAAYNHILTQPALFHTSELHAPAPLSDAPPAETLLGTFRAGASSDLFEPSLSSAFAVSPLDLATHRLLPRLTKANFLSAIRASLTRLGVATLPICTLRVSAGTPRFLLVAAAEAVAEACGLGLVTAAAVWGPNGAKQLREVCGVLVERGVPVVAHYTRYSLLERGAERGGLLEAAQGLGLVTFATEPLARGLLTGKYTDAERLVSPGRRYTREQLAFYKQMTNLMKFVGAVQGGKRPRSIAEVAVKYAMAKGVVPVCGVRTEGQARELLRAVDPEWSLEDCVGLLDEKSDYMAKQRGRR